MNRRSPSLRLLPFLFTLAAPGCDDPEAERDPAFRDATAPGIGDPAGGSGPASDSSGSPATGGPTGGPPTTGPGTIPPPENPFLCDFRMPGADDDLDGAKASSEDLIPAIAAVQLETGRDAWRGLAATLRAHTIHVARATDIEGARAGFEPLSAAVEGMLRTFGNPLDVDMHVAFCPMADDNRGARWVQQGETIDNSYFGESMRRCGEIRTEIAPGGFLAGESETPAGGPGPAGHAH